jgi:hypothetical protein
MGFCLSSHSFLYQFLQGVVNTAPYRAFYVTSLSSSGRNVPGCLHPSTAGHILSFASGTVCLCTFVNDSEDHTAPGEALRL